MPDMTITEAAAILGLSPKTLQEQARRGKLHARKSGGVYLVTPAEVARYAAEHRRTEA